MKGAISRAMMALAICFLGQHRRQWSAAMRAEFETAIENGQPLAFAAGCFLTACRELATREEGRFTIANYALVLGVMIPMAALQTGCALFGWPYLYPGGSGLSGALHEGQAHENLLRSIYLAAVPSLALLNLLLGIGHLWIAWAMLEGNWGRVLRLALLEMAATATLISLMGVLFLNSSQALIQAAVLAVELATISVVAQRHSQLFSAARSEHPG